MKENVPSIELAVSQQMTEFMEDGGTSGVCSVWWVDGEWSGVCMDVKVTELSGEEGDAV